MVVTIGSLLGGMNILGPPLIAGHDSFRAAAAQQLGDLGAQHAQQRALLASIHGGFAQLAPAGAKPLVRYTRRRRPYRWL